MRSAFLLRSILLAMTGARAVELRRFDRNTRGQTKEGSELWITSLALSYSVWGKLFACSPPSLVDGVTWGFPGGGPPSEVA